MESAIKHTSQDVMPMRNSSNSVIYSINVRTNIDTPPAISEYVREFAQHMKRTNHIAKNRYSYLALINGPRSIYCTEVTKAGDNADNAVICKGFYGVENVNWADKSNASLKRYRYGLEDEHGRDVVFEQWIN